MTSIVDRIEEVNKHQNDVIYSKEYFKLVKEYQDLIDKGVAKKRGYTLQTIDQNDILKVRIIRNALEE